MMNEQKGGTPMTAKEYLNQVREAEKKVAWLRRQVSNLRRLITDTSVHLTDMPHTDSPDLQKVQTIMAEIDDLERQIPVAEKEAAAIRHDVGLLICGIQDHIIQDVLTFHYLQGKTWNEIARELGFCNSRIRQLNYCGLSIIDQSLAAGANP